MQKDIKFFKFSRYIKMHKVGVFFYVFFLVVYNLMNILITLLTAKFITEITLMNFNKLMYYLLLILGVSVINYMILMLHCLLLYKVFSQISLEIKNDLIERSFIISSESYNTTQSGTFLSRIIMDPENFVDYVDELVSNLAMVFRFVVTIFYIMFINIWIGLLVLFTIFILGLFETVKAKIHIRNSKAEKKANEKTTSLVNEIIKSEEDIKTLNLDNELRNHSYKNLLNYKKKFFKSHITNSTLWNIRNVLVVFLVSVILFLGIFLVKNTYISVAAFLFIFINKNDFYELTWCLGDITKNLANLKIASQRINELFNETLFPCIQYGKTKVEDCQGEIEFQNVSFSYKQKKKCVDDEKQEEDNSSKQNQDVKSEQKLFENISFLIPKNKTIAFVGKSGSGKTTLVKLISKLYEADSGNILIDGIDIRQFDKDSLRKSISLVNQFPYIFNTTIKENLLFVKNNASDEEIVEVCKKASLGYLINNLPKGINTIVGENGVKLSGGQKQRLAIARALLKNSKIIIFDESTSSLDNISQRDIKESIKNLGGDHTTIVVAHRLSTIKNSDLIYFIEKGKIEDIGTFKELMNTNENFKSLFVADSV